LRRRRPANIGLTFKAWPELLRGIGALFALLFCKKRDKRLYKVEACVRIASFYIPATMINPLSVCYPSLIASTEYVKSRSSAAPLRALFLI